MTSTIQILLIIVIGLCFLSATPLSIIIIRDLKEILEDDKYDKWD